MSIPISPWTLAKIKFYKSAQGWGFAFREGEKDIFIHSSVLERAGYWGRVSQDTIVELQFSEGPKGLTATDIRVPRI